jgi:AcrR family transcriptional regulator
MVQRLGLTQRMRSKVVSTGKKSELHRGVPNSVSYRRPVQSRAIETERRFKDSARILFEEQGSFLTTIDEIAGNAMLHRGALLKRFGSKDGLKLSLYIDYFEDAEERISDYRHRLLEARFRDLDHALFFASKSIEETQVIHLSVTRLMYEDFSVEFSEKRAARSLFCRAVRLVNETYSYFNPDRTHNRIGARACTQLIVTLNFEYVVKALDGFPQDAELRHRMISSAASMLLKEEFSVSQMA